MQLFGLLEAFETVGERQLTVGLTVGLSVLGTIVAALNGDVLNGPTMIERARQKLTKLDATGPIKRGLDLLDAAEMALRGDDGWQEVLGKRLMISGETLHAKGLYGAASDFFSLAQHPAFDGGVRLQAIYRRTFALRKLRRFDDAEQGYLALEQAAMARGDQRMILEAQLGLAKVLINRGNMPSASDAVDAVYAQALSWRDKEMLGKALAERAGVVGRRRDHAAAVQDARSALALLPHGPDRDLCLVNLGWACRETRDHDGAIAAAEEAFTLTRDTETRAWAALLLYQLAIDARDQTACTYWRDGLGGIALTAEQAAEYHLTVARQEATADRFEPAQASVLHMMRIADEHQCAELSIRADIALHEIHRGEIPARYDYKPVPEVRPEPSVTVTRGVDALAGGGDVPRARSVVLHGSRDV